MEQSNHSSATQMFVKWRKVLFPTLVSTVFSGLFLFFDTFFIAITANSPYALGGMSLALPVCYISFGIATMFGAGLGASISKEIAHGEKGDPTKILNTFFPLLFLYSIIAFILIFILKDTMFWISTGFQDFNFYSDWKVQSGDYVGTFTTIGNANLYIIPQMLFCFFLIAQLSFLQIAKATGHANISVWIEVGGALVNILFDFILVYVFRLGVFGASIATVISWIFTFIFFIILYHYFSQYKLRLHNFEWNLTAKSLDKNVLVGLSAGIFALIPGLAFLSFNFMLSIAVITNGITQQEMLDVYQPGYFAAYDIMELLLLFPAGIAYSMQPVIIDEYEREHYHNVYVLKNLGILITSIVAIISILLIFFFNDIIIPIWLEGSKNPLATQFGENILYLFGATFLFSSLTYPLIITLVAIDKDEIANLMTVLKSLLLPIVGILLYFILALSLEPSPVDSIDKNIYGIFASYSFLDLLFFVLAIIFCEIGLKQIKKYSKIKISVEGISIHSPHQLEFVTKRVMLSHDKDLMKYYLDIVDELYQAKFMTRYRHWRIKSQVYDYADDHQIILE